MKRQANESTGSNNDPMYNKEITVVGIPAAVLTKSASAWLLAQLSQYDAKFYQLDINKGQDLGYDGVLELYDQGYEEDIFDAEILVDKILKWSDKPNGLSILVRQYY